MRKILTGKLVTPLTLVSTGCMGSAPEIPHWQGADLTVFDCLEWSETVDLYGNSYSEDCLEWAEQNFSLPYLSTAFSLVVGVQFFLDFSSAYATLTQIYSYRILEEDPIGYSYSSLFQYAATDTGYDLKIGEEDLALSCHFEASLLDCEGLGNNVYNANFSFVPADEGYAPKAALEMFN